MVRCPWPRWAVLRKVTSVILEQSVDTFLMRHERHVHGELTAAARGEIHGVAQRFAEWLRADPGMIDVAYMGGSEVIQTMVLLVHQVSQEVGRGPTFRKAESNDRAETVRTPAADATDAPKLDVWPYSVNEGWLPPQWRVDGSNDSAAKVGLREASAQTSPERQQNDDLGPYVVNEDLFELIKDWLHGGDERKDGGPSTRRRLFIGNDPLVSWLAAELAGPVPFAHGELVGLARRKRTVRRRSWRVAWTIAPGDDKQVDPILAKVRSKMSTAGSLGAVITGLLVFLLQNGVDRASWWSWLSLAAFVGSAGWYFVALFYLDTLSMPSRFWGSQRAPRRSGLQRRLQRIADGWSGVRRPPSSTARVLQEAMVHTWTWIFLPATLLAGLGVILLIGGQAWPPPKHAKPIEPNVWGLALVAVYLLALAVFACIQRPNLGASD